MSTDTQCEQILRYMAQGHSITPLEALEKFQCFALSQRIGELKRQRWPIADEFVTLKSGKRVKQYWLPEARQKPMEIA